MKSTNYFFLFIIFFTSTNCINAQSWGYNNNRIAVTADGNSEPDNHPEAQWPKGDPDDIGATPASLAIIAKLGLQDKLVHYSYNNFVGAPAGPDNTNEMKISADGAIIRWDYDDSKFYDITKEIDAARTSLASEMSKSTASDPLYLILAGLSEFLYQAVEEVVNNGDINSLSHVYLVSHSGFNENHKRRNAHHTWDQTQTLSGNRINYKKIQDQNNCGNPNALWCSGNSNYTPYNWMNTHNDESINWMYDRMKASGLADISDCGMLFYLLQGDANGSPSKFENFLGDGVDTDTDTGENCDTKITYNALNDFPDIDIAGFVPAYKDQNRNALAVDATQYKDVFAAAEATFSGEDGIYDITITTLKELDGECTYKLNIDGKPAGEFQNPTTTVDYELYTYTFKNITVNKENTIQVAFNSSSNGQIPEGDAFAYARGRWRQIEFVCVSDSDGDDNCSVSEKNGIMILEAENIPLKGQWAVQNDPVAADGAYIHYKGPNHYNAVDPDETIDVKFKINNPGKYTVKWLMRQPSEAEDDKSNDAWINFPDAKQHGGPNIITGFNKFVGRNKETFGMNGQLDLHGTQPWLNVEFDQAGTYTLQLSARSELFQLDRIVLYKGINFDQAVQMVSEMEETSDCEDFIDQSDWEVIFVDSEAANGNSPKEYAIDEKLNTFWHTAWHDSDPNQRDPLPHEIQVDMKQSYDLTQFYYLPRQDQYGPNGTIGNYELYISNDLNNWGNPVVNESFDWPANATKEDFKKLQKIELPTNISGRYFKLIALSEAQNNPNTPYTSAAELRFSGTPSDVLGVSDPKVEEISLYPNPASSLVYINTEFQKIQLFTVTGQKVFETSRSTFDISKLDSGVYFVKIKTANGNTIKQLIKK